MTGESADCAPHEQETATGRCSGTSDFVVVICTRDRARQVAGVLDALEAQTRTGHEVLVVDQTQPPDAALAARASSDPRLAIALDDGAGLSRARNLAWRQLASEWVVYLDDDCRPEPDWAAALHEVLARAGRADLVSGHVSGGPPPANVDYLEVTAFPVVEESIVSGRWTAPWKAGVGVCMAVRRSAVHRLDGWDERLGVGSAGPFGAAEDMDFNYRLLRKGGQALLTPTVRAWHEQWRPAAELAPLYERYMRGWCGFAMKHLRCGDVAGGLWLWSMGAVDVLRMLGSAARRRSRFRLRVALSKLRGLLVGTASGLFYRW